MPGPWHGFLSILDRNRNIYEVFNHARTAAYLANPDHIIDGVEICSILDFGGCENYTYAPTCDPPEGGYIDLAGTTGNTVSTPDAAALDITGDITLIAYTALPDWTPASSTVIFGKGGTYRLLASSTGRPTIEWTDSGATLRSRTVPVDLPVSDGEPLWLAMSLDVNGGASNHVAYAYTSHDGVNWDLLGSLSTASTTSIQASTNQLYISGSGPTNLNDGNIAYAEVRSGLITNGLAAGTSVFKFDGEADLEGVPNGSASFTSSSGHVMSVGYSGTPDNEIVPFVNGGAWMEQSFDSPATDPAPWYNANYPESADAYGFYIEEWTGLDDKHVTRPSTNWGGHGGGATLGAATSDGRTMTLNLILFGQTEEAVEYLFRWLGATLTGVCSTCATDSILIRRFCGSTENPEYGVAELRRVGLTRGLGWEAEITRRANCQIRRASVILTAGDPCMYLPSTDVPITDTDANADLTTCLSGAPIDPDREICRPSCSELTAGCRTIRTFEVSPMAAIAPVVTFSNFHDEHAFPFRAIVYADPREIGATPNPCGLEVVGEVYVRALPPYSTLIWDVTGREVRYQDATTGPAVSTMAYIEPNDPPRKRFFAMPCTTAHLVMEPATMCVDDLGSGVYEAGGIEFADPHFPTVTMALQERTSCA